MDINGVKPVASRIKQRPLGAKTKTHISGQNASAYFGDASALQASSSMEAAPTVSVAETATEHKDYLLPQYHAPVHSEKIVRKHLTRRGLVLRGAVACFVVAVTLAGLLLWNGYVKFHKVFHGKSIVAALTTKSSPTPQLLQGQSNGRVNILLSGIGGSGNYDPNLTDTITLLSIDPVNNKATIVNLPSDLWVQQQIAPYSTRQQELNAVYEGSLGSTTDDPTTNPDATQAGLNNLDQVVEKVTGVSVNYNLLINFQAFEQAVNVVGGINVNVPAELYDSTLAWKDHVSPVIAKAGVQQMNGNQALLYVRSRQTANGFTQVQRELQVLTALKDKTMSVGTWSDPNKLEGLMSSLGSNVYTDMSIEGAGQLYSLMNKIGDNNISSINLVGSSLNLLTSERVDGLTVAVPVSGLNSYAAIQEYIRTYMSSGYVEKENAPVTVVSTDATGATLTANMLKSYGFNVTATATTTQRVSRLTLVDVSGGTDATTLKALEGHYKTTAVTEVPAGINIPAGSAKFVIIEP